MIEHSPGIAELCKALHGAQGQMTGVFKDAKNPHFKNRYASLENVLDTARPALQAHGLSVTQAPGKMVDGAVEITTMLMHSSGEWMRSTLHMPVVKRDPQGVGSAITYGLRYALMAVLGLPPSNDDDGEAAMSRGSSVPSREAEADHGKDRYIASCRAQIAKATDGPKLRDWWMSEDEKAARRDFGLSQDEIDSLKTAMTDRLRAIGQAGDDAGLRRMNGNNHSAGQREGARA